MALPGPFNSPVLALEVDGGGPFWSMAISLEMRAERWWRVSPFLGAMKKKHSVVGLWEMSFYEMHTIIRSTLVVALCAGCTLSPAKGGVEATRALPTAQPLTPEPLTL